MGHSISTINGRPAALTPDEEALMEAEFGKAARDGEITHEEIYDYLSSTNMCCFSSPENPGKYLALQPVGQILYRHHVSDEEYLFDSGNPIVLSFLRLLGFTPEMTADGVLSQLEMDSMGMVLYHPVGIQTYIGGVSERVGRSIRLAPEEAAPWLKISQHMTPSSFRLLFDRTWKCSCRTQLSENMFHDIPSRRSRVNLPIFPLWLEGECQDILSKGFPAKALVDIHFGDRQATKELQQLGQTVLKIELQRQDQAIAGASAVLVSSQGHLMSAYHVLFDEHDVLRPRISVAYGDRRIGILQKNILYFNKAEDLVAFQLPELAGQNLPFAKIATTLDISSADSYFYAIGYSPSFVLGEGRELVVRSDLRAYTVGTLHFDAESQAALEEILKKSPSLLETMEHEPPKFISLMGMVGGFSGGGLFDGQGKLVAINSSILDHRSVGFHSPLVPSRIRDPQLKALIEEISSIDQK